jgi:tetratricopeptide (TPR) repeat protein
MHVFKSVFYFIFFLWFISCNNGSGNDKQSVKENKKPSTPQESLKDSVLSDSAQVQNIEQLVQNNNYSKALEKVEKLLAKDSANPGWLYMKADALERSGDTASALLFYNKAVNAAGTFIEAEMRAAILFAEKGNSNALTITNRLLKTATANSLRSDILRVQGIYYARTGDHSKAINIFDRIIKEDYTYMDAYIEKGWVYYDLKKYEEALQVFSKSTNVSNKFAEGYFWMAKTEEKLNKREEAIANYKRSLALDQGLNEAREALKRLGEIK